MRQPLGMKATFILALVGFSAVMSVGLATVSAYRITSDLREQLDQRGEGLTTNLAHEASRVLRVEDSLERELSLMLLTHRLIGDVVYAQIVHNGAVVSESTLHDDIKLAALTNPAEIPPIRERIVNGHPTVEFIQILPENPEQNYVRLGLSLEQVQEKVQRNLFDMAALAVLFTAVGAAVAFGLYSAILKPLERVIESIRQFQAGNLGARVELSTYPELRELGTAFNLMAEVIGRRNEELQRVNAELRSASEAKSEFLAMIGHELKTPLHSVRGYCQILLEELDGPLTAEQQSDIEAVLASGNHLLSLIDNILHFSASGAELLHVTSFPLADLLQQAAYHIKPLAHRKSLDVRVDPGDCELVHADETKLKQILINLLHNAVKYTRGGSVEVSACNVDGGFQIQVCDTGPGIPEAEKERIFEPFERIERTERDEMKGLGLGLSIVKGYVQAHGGTISVADAPGGGACFSLSFPVTPIVNRERWGLKVEDTHRGGRSGGTSVADQVFDGQRI